ncbi:hypothetical protein MJO28_011593 [Puccinia striiformis f. sp. tritici]|uniref:Uncharacterized protein n=1 Tax=Puccinia striiformis f. sp. tritici TaxID=168172 RepID=A0ACC0E4S2_9BASI|nr:hypothetical protein MJO28_011593 [Puccinia striiformis f. sp. tritici]KAI7946835.1 hypothetical protein MJO29_011362 [Puccinia striiformis f. sp. tritici]
MATPLISQATKTNELIKQPSNIENNLDQPSSKHEPMSDIWNHFTKKGTATLKLGKTHLPAVQIIFKTMKKIDKQLQDAKINGLSHLSDIIKPMRRKYNKYWLKMKDFTAVNKVFDPRCKFESLGFTLVKQTPDPNDPSATSLVKIKSNLATWFKEIVPSKQRSTSNLMTGKYPDPNHSQALVEDNKDVHYNKYLEAKKATHVGPTTAKLNLYLQELPALSDLLSFSFLSW